jgi:high-affinity K+ transport system ATPase subunit B
VKSRKLARPAARHRVHATKLAELNNVVMVDIWSGDILLPDGNTIKGMSSHDSARLVC